MLNKLLLAATGAAVAIAPVAADAQYYGHRSSSYYRDRSHYYYDGHHYRDRSNNSVIDTIIGGLLGYGLGVATSGGYSNYGYSNYGYAAPAYGYGYAAPAYGYGYSYPSYSYGYSYPSYSYGYTPVVTYRSYGGSYGGSYGYRYGGHHHDGDRGGWHHH